MKMQQTMPEQEMQEQYLSNAMHQMGSAASHTIVGRTQRLVRERATENQSQRRKLRSLWLPLLVCSAMIVMIAHSAWALVEQWNTQIADSAESTITSAPLLMLTLWFLPLTVGILVMILFHRGRMR